MKKRMLICSFVFTVCLFHLLTSDVVFGSAQGVFNNKKELLLREDIRVLLPDVLEIFKRPELQKALSPIAIGIILKNPLSLRGQDPEIDNQFLALLTIDDDLRALFRDEQFYNVLKSTSEINNLIRLIEEAEPAQPTQQPTTLLIVSGYGQSGSPGTRLGSPFVVEVRDQYGAVLSGVSVTFRVTKGGGTLSRTTARTDSLGRASTRLTLGSAGANWVEASVVEITQKQTFTATATEPRAARKATTLSIVSGYGQSGSPGTRLGSPFVVEVRDQYGAVLSGVSVTFRVTKGGGTLSRTTARTDSLGRASTRLTLGSAGANWVEASVVEITQKQTFTATATQDVLDTSVVSVEHPPVYWIKGGQLYHFTDDDEEKKFGPDWDEKVTSLAVDVKRGKVYWTAKRYEKNGGTWRIVSADFNGRNPQPVKELERGNVPYGIAVDTEKGKLYVTSSTWRKVQRLNVDGTGFESAFISTTRYPYSPKHIAVDIEGGMLYWTESGADEKWSIWSAGLDGRNRKLFLERLGELGGIAVAGDRLYWTEKAGPTSGKVAGADLPNGSNFKPHVLLEDRIPLGITADAGGNRLYWTTSLGDIQSLNLDRDPIALGVASGVSASPGAPSAIGGYSAQSVLLANYPNPFNPETWIPYQLSAASDVTVSIYSVDGSLVRRLTLGHQAAGIYHRKSRAAYWDGRNAFGERVASGLYFYTLTAGDFTATRKMLIRK